MYDKTDFRVFLRSFSLACGEPASFAQETLFQKRNSAVSSAMRRTRRREREREEAEIEAMEEPKPENMEEARRRVLGMADETAEFRF